MKLPDPYICTELAPWTPSTPGTFFLHPDAIEVGEQRVGWPAGDEQDMECPWCKKRWTKELPQ